MKKRSLVLVLCIVLVAGILSGCSGGGSGEEGGQPSGEPIAMRCAYDVPAGGSMAKAIERFEELVDADPELQGVIDVQLFPGGQLFAANETLDATLRGDVELGMFTTWYASSISDKTPVFDLPFLFDNVEHMVDFVTNSDLIDEVWAPFEEVGGKCWGGTVTGEYGILSAKKEIIVPDDVKGLKIRSVGDGSLTWLALGASPVDLVAGDIFTGLQRGMIDAADIGPISVKDRNLFEVSEHYLHIFNHSTLSIYVVNTEWLDSLPAGVAEKLEQHMKDAIAYCNTEVSKDMVIALDLMEQNGIKIHTATAEEKALWRAAVEDVYQELGYNRMGQEFMDKLMAWVEK